MSTDAKGLTFRNKEGRERYLSPEVRNFWKVSEEY
jgi:hypothetical protein